MELKIEKPTDMLARMSMILWGDAGCGKTTLAATAPGRKLFIALDPDGDMSIDTCLIGNVSTSRTRSLLTL